MALHKHTVAMRIKAIQTSPGESKSSSFKTPAQALGLLPPHLQLISVHSVERQWGAREDYVHQDSFLFSSSEYCCEVPDRSDPL